MMASSGNPNGGTSPDEEILIQKMKSEGIANNLMEHHSDCFQLDTLRRIYDYDNRQEKNKVLLQIVLEASDRGFEHFLKQLEKTNQMNLIAPANELRKSIWVKETATAAELATPNFQYPWEDPEGANILINNIDIAEIVKTLAKQGCLSKEDKEHILNPTDKQSPKGRRLLNVLSRQGMDTKASFDKELLNSGHYHHLARLAVQSPLINPFQSRIRDMAGLRQNPVANEYARTRIGSIPLILPRSHKYIASKAKLEKVGLNQDVMTCVPEAMEMLRKLDVPVSVVGICGAARTGKSLLLSTLMGVGDAFKRSSSMETQTVGIWIGTHTLETKTGKQKRKINMIFLDSEGIGSLSGSNTSDAKIVTLMILLCSHLIYNSVDVPKQSDIEPMNFFARIAKRLLLVSGTDANGHKHKSLPKLHWILRDVTKDAPDDSQQIWNHIMEISGQRCKEELSWYSIFPDREISMLTLPHYDRTIIKDLESHALDVSCEFRQGLAKIMLGIYESCVQKQKTGEGGKPLTGKMLADLIQKYVEQLNTDESVPSIRQAWEYVIENEEAKKAQEYSQKYDELMQDLFDDNSNGRTVPLEEVDRGTGHISTLKWAESATKNSDKKTKRLSLLELHEQVCTTLQDNIKNYLQSQERIDHFKQLWKMVEEIIVFPKASPPASIFDNLTGGKLEVFRKLNQKISHKYCEELFDRVKNSFVSKVYKNDEVCSNKEFDQFVDQTNENIENDAIGPGRKQLIKRMHSFIEEEKGKAKLQRKVQEQDFRINELTKESKESEQLRAQYIRNEEYLKSHIFKLEETHRAKDDEVKRRHEEVEHHKCMIQKKEDEIETLKSDTSRLNSDMNKKQNVLKRLSGEVKKLKTKHTELQEHLHDAKSEKDQVENELHEVNEKLKSKEATALSMIEKGTKVTIRRSLKSIINPKYGKNLIGPEMEENLHRIAGDQHKKADNEDSPMGPSNECPQSGDGDSSDDHSSKNTDMPSINHSAI